MCWQRLIMTTVILAMREDRVDTVSRLNWRMPLAVYLSPLPWRAPQPRSTPGLRSIFYRNPSAKAPVIHLGDEAPFPFWRGEGSALRYLTEGIEPAMIGIDVLA